MGSHSGSSCCHGEVQEPKFLMGIRQNPHYRQLKDKPKSIRNNLIAGYDKVFVEAAGKIQSLASTKDLESSKEELRATLAELEDMGYDVGLLTKRLDALEGALGSAILESDETRAKIDEAKRKVEEKKEELSAIKSEIASLRAKEQDKQQGIDELVKWVEKLEVKRPDMDAAFSKLAKAPLI